MHPSIVRLYANNYRCFVNFELRPGRRGLLLGYNGSGKSSVLDVLSAIRGIARGVDVVDAFPTQTVTRFGGSAEQRFELDVESDWGTFCYSLRLAHNLEEESATIASEEVTLDGGPVYRFSDGEVQLYGDDHAPARNAFPVSPQRSFLGSVGPKGAGAHVSWFRAFVANILVLRLDPPRMIASSTLEHEDLSPDGSNFASYCRHVLQASPDVMERAHETLREIIPGFQRLRMQAAGRSRVLTATFRYPGGKTYDLDFDALSDGQKSLIALYVAVHDRKPYPSVLCLDEPDNFVSIREIQPFLVELADVSDQTGTQVLLISHSSEVIDYLGAEGAILLERPEGGHTRVGTLGAPGALRLSEMMARGWHGAA